MAQGDQDRDLNRNENLKISSFEWHRFLIGCGLFTISVGFAVWGFSKEVLYDHQRQILVWILPLAAGFSAGAFAGSISVKSRKLIPGVAVTATSGFAVWLLCFLFLFPAQDSISRPLVVLMDSTLPQVVYDPLTRDQGGTNSDDLSEIFDDLPIRITTEKTSLIWRREEQVRKMEPDLIVIHLSSFYERTNVLDSDERFRSFLRYMKNSKTRFLVYTRGLHGTNISPQLRARWDAQLTFLRDVMPASRLEVFVVKGGSQATFRDPTTARNLKLLVKTILGLE